MPRLDKTCVTQFASSQCEKQLRVALHPDTFAHRAATRFGLPLQMTETTLVSGDLMPAEIVDLNDFVVDDWPSTPEGEARQAADLVEHYTTAFSHPAVESVTYWGMPTSPRRGTGTWSRCEGFRWSD